MLSAFANCLKIPELRNKIFLTLELLLVARVAAHIPLPGLDPTPLLAYFEAQSQSGGADVLALYNMFTGGALLKGAVGALGVMPYISASIIFQLLGAVWPALARLQQEGDVGRQKLTQYTRYATVVICIVQALLMVALLQNPSRLFDGFSEELVLIPGWMFTISSVILLTAGSLLMMWLGEQITQRGIGNGVSILITVGIVAQLPLAFKMTYNLFNPPIDVEGLGAPQGVLMLALLFIVIAGMVALSQGMRKIPVQYAKRVIGKRVFGGQSSFLPLKVNYSGVMPVIFAVTIIVLPNQVLNGLGARLDLGFLNAAAASLQPGAFTYYLVKLLLILFFSYFWVSVMFRPIQIADDLKKHNGYVPGVRPGEPTAKFLDFVMTRLTLAGAIGLTAVAILPDLLSQSFRIPYAVSTFFGGTSMLIAVGVSLDTMRQVETFLLQRHYDGFLRKGRVRSRATPQRGVGQAAALGEAAQSRHVLALGIPLVILLVIGIAAWATRTFTL